jgi:hypothetical protein
MPERRDDQDRSDPACLDDHQSARGRYLAALALAADLNPQMCRPRVSAVWLGMLQRQARQRSPVLPCSAE